MTGFVTKNKKYHCGTWGDAEQEFAENYFIEFFSL